MLIPCITAAVYREKSGMYFLIIAAMCGILGVIATHKKPDNTVFYSKEGFVSVALSWLVLSFFGALPFYISGEIPVFEDAMFETISGFTTTGASILQDVEGLSQCMLIWRSFTHWIGGMGVLVFLLTVIPIAGGYNMHIMKAESPGPSVGKLVPRIKQTAKILYLIYLVMTLAEIALLLLGKMPLFDALATAFGTAGTGGFGIKNNSIAYYDSYYLQGVVTVFMILFGINFNVYYLFLIKRAKEAFKSEEMRWYLILIASATLLITINISKGFTNIFQAFHHSAFQVASIITTTGFSTVDFNLWPQFSKNILLMLMFVGACAGSTGGGIKVSRFVIAIKAVHKEITAIVHPRVVKIIKLEHKPLEHEVIRSTNAFFMAYTLIFTISVIIIGIDGFDFTTNFTAVAATFNNIGPGFSEVGATGNFSMFSPMAKYILMFDMLAGRLEIFPMLLLFSPGVWKKNY